MEIVIGILTGGLVCMALLVVVQSRNVLRRNQRPPDQALVSMVQDLVTAVLVEKRELRWRQDGTPVPVPPSDEAMAPAYAEDEPEDTADPAMQVAHMGPVGS